MNICSLLLRKFSITANGPSMNERFRDKDGFRFAHVYQMEFGTDIRFYYNGFVFRSPKDKLDKLVKTAKTDLPARYRHLENSPLANYYIHTKLLDVREDLVPDLHYMIDHAEELWDRGNQHINYTVFSKTLPKSKQHGPLTWDQLPKQVFDGLLEPDSFPKTSLSKGAKEAPW
ncbi:uncharacterized protein LOC129581308 isoform X2 [Paramacrobiotus metropolitanus]|uniref:uncharacterized protein LOC129581308 isoform X2 n=1 Tax=Paramacrobiotus metropolitanus TaxID=2943436 RepID=UPI002446219D|nr:uncharacterized protein LOC129581308 isoform X2 [Paramacrobiotus metropolitanus]